MAVDLHWLEQALVLARHRSFARAAAFLHVSQPTLSRSIARLERALGARLFDRGRDGAEPTAHGRLLLERGALLLADEAALRREIERLSGLEIGELVVGAGTFPALISVGLAAARLHASHPGLRLDLVSGDADEIAAGIREGRLELGVVSLAAANSEPQLEGEQMEPHPLALYAAPGHPLARQHRLTLDRVVSFPLVCSRIRGEIARRLPTRSPAGVLDATTQMFTPAIHVEAFDVARRIARESLAVLPAVPGLVRDDVEAGRLVRLDFAEPWLLLHYGLFHRRGRRLSPAGEAFVAAFRAVEASLREKPSDKARPARAASTARRRDRPRASALRERASRTT